MKSAMYHWKELALDMRAESVLEVFKNVNGAAKNIM